MSDIEKWLAESEKRCEAATNEPWRVSKRGLTVQIGETQLRIRHQDGDRLSPEIAHQRFEQARDDLTFTAHARTDLPAALALIRRYRETLERFVRICRWDHDEDSAARRDYDNAAVDARKILETGREAEPR